MARFVGLMMFLVSLSATAQDTVWYIFAHDDGCVPLTVLNRKGELGHAPASPKEYVEMMAAQGKAARLNTHPTGFPDSLSGKVVVVELGQGRSLVFVKDVVCRNIGK